MDNKEFNKKVDIRIKEQELDSLIALDNTAYWKRTGEDYSKQIKRCREELDELKRRKD